MISLRLWQSLMMPFVSHPIYWRYAVWEPPSSRGGRSIQLGQGIRNMRNRCLGRVMLFFLLAASLAVIAFLGSEFLVVIFVGFLLAAIFLGIPFALIGIGTLYGMACVVRISDAIANERVQGRFTLLGLTSQGYIGATWALCSLELHTHPGFRKVRQFIHSFYIVIIALLIIPLAFSWLAMIAASIRFDSGTYTNLMALAVFVTMIFMDYIQSTITGCLVGMIAPTLARSRSDTRLVAVGLFLALQAIIYLLIAFICLLLWPLVLNFRVNLGTTYVLLCAGTFYICREITLIFLWLALAECLEVPLSEMKAITRVDILPSL